MQRRLMTAGAGARAAVMLLIALACALVATAQGEPPTLWSASTMQMISPTATPPVQVGPAAFNLEAPINGVASSVVVVNFPAPGDGPAARLTDLTGPAGTIPASRLLVRYAEPRTGGYVPLYDTPRTGKTVHPIWLTVTVPADAKAGTYTGTVTLELGAKVSVPVTLTVHNCVAPNPHDYRNVMNLLQSPEAVAGYYNVPLWSDKHFALIEKSLAYMGQLGNDILGVTAIGNSVFGNDPIIVFRREQGKLVPDFRYLTRYLDLYEKYCGKPMFLGIHVWDYGCVKGGELGRGYNSTFDDENPTLKVAELQGDTLVMTDAPMYNRPGSEEMWQAVFDGLRAQLKQRGWAEDCLMLGCGGDMWPSTTTVSFFKKIIPSAQWRVLTHGQGAPKWSYSDDSRTQPNGLINGYHEAARLLPNNRPHVEGHPVCTNARDHVGDSPATFRALTWVINVENGYDGMCWKGLDYWAYKNAAGQNVNPLNSYVHFGNMVGGTPRAILAPGPDGAVATQQFENLRLGLQEYETIMAMRDGVNALYPPPFKQCDVTELSLTNGVCRPGRGGALNQVDLVLSIYWNGDQIGVIPQARGFNSYKREGSGRVVKQNPLTFELNITLDRDNANKEDCTGTYHIEVTRTGDTYTGTYTGTYRGYERKGEIVGGYCPKAYTLQTGPVPDASPLALRVEAAAEAAGTNLGIAAGEAQAMRTLYGQAAEVTAAVKQAGK